MKSKSTENSLSKFSSDELLNELRNRPDILSVQVLKLNEVENWLCECAERMGVTSENIDLATPHYHLVDVVKNFLKKVKNFFKNN